MDKTETLFHDTYTGPRYTYGLRYRPLGIGAQPRGWIVGSLRDDPAGPMRYRHGLVDYPRRLTPNEEASYEMDRVVSVEAVNSKGADVRHFRLEGLTLPRAQDGPIILRDTEGGDAWVLNARGIYDALTDMRNIGLALGFDLIIKE